MAEERKEYRISDIYQGGYSSLTPSYTGYIPAGSFGMTTDPRTANILQEVSTKLSSGAKNIEVEAVSPEIFDSIPKQQLKEVHRLSKLTGVDVSLHAPVMDVSGIDPRGGGFSEVERETSERKVTETLLRAHELNPDGNIPVNFHTAEGIPSSQLLPPSKRKEGEEYRRMIVINRETGRLAPIEPEKVFRPGEEGIKMETRTAEKQLQFLNETEWDNTISQIEINRQRVDEILEDADPVSLLLYANWVVAQNNPKAISEQALEELKNMTPVQSQQIRKIHAASIYADQAIKTAYSAFDKAVKNSRAEEEKKLLENAAREYKKIVGVDENGKVENLSRALNPQVRNEALFHLIQGLEKVTPEIYVPLEKFAIEKSSESFGNAAWEAYNKLKGKNVPILTIENPPAGFALSTGADVKNVVEKSREQFVKNAVSNGLSENDAKKQAEKLIGATWDVGHINMLRKFGYSEEDLIEETKKIAPLLKHVHLSDNFGFEHTELPMGMGNVPLKEMMKELGKKGFEARKIIEAAAWWQHWKTPPFQETLEAIGSPIYGMKMAPYWSQAPGLYQGYFSGFGQTLPQINYETFGAGFSRLPTELGGQIQGTGGSRMSGRPME